MIVQILGIIAITTVIVSYFNFELQRREIKRTNNANVKGWLGIKSDRINGRIEKLRLVTRKQNTTIDIKDFDECIKQIEILIAQELTYKGREEVQNERNNLRVRRQSKKL